MDSIWLERKKKTSNQCWENIDVTDTGIMQKSLGEYNKRDF